MLSKLIARKDMNIENNVSRIINCFYFRFLLLMMSFMKGMYLKIIIFNVILWFLPLIFLAQQGVMV